MKMAQTTKKTKRAKTTKAIKAKKQLDVWTQDSYVDLQKYMYLCVGLGFLGRNRCKSPSNRVEYQKYTRNLHQF